MSGKLPPEFDISGVGIGALVGILTVADALEYLKDAYRPYLLRVVWTVTGEENGYGVKDADVPSGMTLDDLRHHTANQEAVVRLESGGGASTPRVPTFA